MHTRRLGLMAALFGLLLALDASAKQASENYRWRSVPIGGGGFVSGLVFHPHEKGLLYARTDIGGAYRWDAVAGEWQSLTDWIGRDDANLMGIDSLAVDPSDPERVYLAAGTYTTDQAGNAAILRSADRGRTFTRSDLPFKLGGNELGRGNGERLAVDPNDGRVLLLGSRTHGLWRSDDHGARWSQVKAFPQIATSPSASAANKWRTQQIGIVFVVFDPRSGKPGSPSKRLYAGVSTRETSLYVSEDAGATWKPVAGQPVGLRPNHMVRASDGSYYLSYGDEPGPDQMHDGAVWKYEPAQQRWTDITPAPQSIDTQGDGFGWGAVAVDPRNPQVLIASTFCRYGPRDELFRSIDGGKTWKPVLERSDYDHSASPWTAQATPHWLADVEIDPFDGDRALFVTGYGAWTSRNLTAFDQGERVQWRFENRGFEETVPLALLSPSQGAPLISGLGDIDGFVHDRLDRTTVQFAKPPRYSNTESMSQAGRAPDVLVRSGHFHDDPGNVARAAYSLDAGRTWREFAGEPPEGDGAGHITVAADGKRVLWQPRKAGHWLSADFGAHWRRVKGLPATAVVEADRVDAALYYGFDPVSGKLYVSGDGGVTFKETAGGIGAIGERFRAQLRPAPGHSGTVYIAASWRGLLRWSAKGLERLPKVENAFALGLGKPKDDGGAPTLFVYGQIDGKIGVYRSEDDGRHWTRIDDDAHRFGDIRLVVGDPRVYGRVYLGTHGRGIVYGEPRE
ncbi:cellulase [Lysobacter cavernae]|uniref:Cellulase n=1 Tax=Lysobacter cavernae TaxID=1685901 RepID=A0ABV7RPF8_9GAMM